MFFLAGIAIFILMLLSPLSHKVFHIDEFFTLAALKFSFGDIITINVNDVHPPLYYLILKACSFVGSDIFALKMLSAVCYIGILAFSYFVLEREYGWIVCGLFSLCMVCMCEFLNYFFIARMYSFALIFLLAAFYSYKRILESDGDRYWVMLVVFSLLGAYTHYFAAISAFVIYLMLLIYLLRNNGGLKKFLLAVGSSVVLYSPWILALIMQLGRVRKNFWIDNLTLGDFIRCLSYYATPSTNLFVVILAVAVFMAFAVMLLRSYRDMDEAYWILSGFCVFILTILIGAVLSVTYKPILIPRYLIPAAGVLWLSVCVMLVWLKNRDAVICLALVLMLCVCGLWGLVNYDAHLLDKANRYEDVLGEVGGDADIVIVNSPFGLMEFADYFKDAEIYTFGFSDFYGVGNESVHEIYDFGEVDSAYDLIWDNSDKNIYFFDASGPGLDDVEKSEAGRINSDFVFYKISS